MEEKRMNKRKMVQGLSTLAVLLAIALVATSVQAQDDTHDGEASGYHFEAAKLGAGIALGLCGVGTGLSQGPIGAAAVGMIAEDSSKFVTGLIFTALPETIVLFGFLALFLL